MVWLLDTNHWIALLKRRCAPLAKFPHFDPTDIAI
jgi:predicted nucleic acid-binding protein